MYDLECFDPEMVDFPIYHQKFNKQKPNMLIKPCMYLYKCYPASPSDLCLFYGCVTKVTYGCVPEQHSCHNRYVEECFSI